MHESEKRIFHRNRVIAPITYAKYNTDHYYDAKMFNFSRQGMYLQPAIDIPRGSDIHIVMINYSPGTYGPEAYKSYVGRIRWRKGIGSRDVLRYGLGVELVEKCHDAHGITTAREIKYSCNLCGELILSEETGPMEREISDNPNAVHLCPNCSKHFSAFPDGQIKSSIERFLSGNVI